MQVSSASIQWPHADQPGLRTFELPEGGRGVLIGRAGGASIHLADPTVSRAHAELSHMHGAWLIEDVGSGAGTYVLRRGRAKRVEGRERLRHGDRIRVGRTVLKFQDPPMPEQDVATLLLDEDTVVLTGREREVLEALCADELAGVGGWPNDAGLAQRLVIAESTAKTHMQRLYAKFDLGAVPNSQKRARLVRRAIDDGWVVPGDSR